jgi:hypothetical protein
MCLCGNYDIPHPLLATVLSGDIKLNNLINIKPVTEWRCRWIAQIRERKHSKLHDTLDFVGFSVVKVFPLMFKSPSRS